MSQQEKKHWLEVPLVIAHVVFPIVHLLYEFIFGGLNWGDFMGLKGVFELIETVVGLLALYVFRRVHFKSKSAMKP